MDLMFLFYVTVWKMRQSQIAYFKERKRSDLLDAKRYESMVDTELEKRLVFVDGKPTRLDTGADLRPTVEPTQANLFKEDGNEAKS